MSLPPPLAPRLTPRTADLLATPSLLHDLTDALGSPLNVVLPDQVADNLEGFRAVYGRHALRGEVFYAHKANRSSALVRRLAETPGRLDVASLRELQHVLGAGFAPDRVMVTGPKTPELLWLAARTGVTVNVDSGEELELLAATVAGSGCAPVDVLLRLSAFGAAGTRVLTRRSRFGSGVHQLDDLLATLDKHRDAVSLVGVAYHLDTIGLPEKATALEGCLTVLDECQRRGFGPRVVDIGGGYGVDYLADGAQWEHYTSELTRAVLGRREPMTWQGHGYGLRNEGGTVRGALGLYPAHRPVAGPDYLDALLSLPAPSLGRPLATLLLEGLYELWTEPGRALVDQCGISLARVVEVRRGSSGDLQVSLAMNARDVSLEEHGVVMDPVLLPRDGRAGARAGSERPVGAYLLGNLCLEADLITRRLVRLPALPRPGDLLAFPNTAGYVMDFSADHALQQPVARTVAARHDGERWRWCLDEEYWPTTTTTTLGGRP